MTTVTFLSNRDEISWRFPAKPWFTYGFEPKADVDKHQVWKFLHSCTGNICIVPTRYSYDIIFDVEASKDKFEMFAKLSDWVSPTSPTSPYDPIAAINRFPQIPYFSKKYILSNYSIKDDDVV